MVHLLPGGFSPSGIPETQGSLSASQGNRLAQRAAKICDVVTGFLGTCGNMVSGVIRGDIFKSSTQAKTLQEMGSELSCVSSADQSTKPDNAMSIGGRFTREDSTIDGIQTREGQIWKEVVEKKKRPSGWISEIAQKYDITQNQLQCCYIETGRKANNIAIVERDQDIKDAVIFKLAKDSSSTYVSTRYPGVLFTQKDILALVNMGPSFKSVQTRENTPIRDGGNYAKLGDRYTNIGTVKREAQVTLQDGSYINATKIGITGVPSQYIATQGPLESTVSHFLQMVMEQKATTVVSLVNPREGEKDKCAEWWPTVVNSSKTVGDYKVTCTNIDRPQDFQILDSNAPPTPYMVSRTLTIYDKKTKMSQTVTQIHVVNWPDHGVIPLELMDKLQKKTEGKGVETPIVVHCSAGIGRTGAFIAAHSIRAEKKNLEGNDLLEAVHNRVNTLRSLRSGMVQEKEQFELVYESCLSNKKSVVITVDDETARLYSEQSEKAVLYKPPLETGYWIYLVNGTKKEVTPTLDLSVYRLATQEDIKAAQEELAKKK